MDFPEGLQETVPINRKRFLPEAATHHFLTWNVTPAASPRLLNGRQIALNASAALVAPFKSP